MQLDSITNCRLEINIYLHINKYINIYKYANCLRDKCCVVFNYILYSFSAFTLINFIQYINVYFIL